MIRRASVAVLCAWAGTAPALDLPMNATVSREAQTDYATLELPVSAWTDNGMQTVDGTGTITRRAWRVPQSSTTTLQAMEPIRQHLEDQGYKVLFDCETRVCGGFDFRYALDLLPEPEMHVNLGDFRYLTAHRPDSEDLVGIVVSRGAGDLFVHEARVSKAALPPVGPPPPESPTLSEAATPAPNTPVVASRNGNSLTGRLETDGHAVLDDLEFATGSSELEPRAFGSLAELASWLRDTPDASVVLVGHSDATGTLGANVALSRARAQSVVERLVSTHAVTRGQIRAEGVGYLAPLASNATPEGRAANRRVEVIFVNPG